MKILVLLSAAALVGSSAAFVAGCSSDPQPTTTTTGSGSGGQGGSSATGSGSGSATTTSSSATSSSTTSSSATTSSGGSGGAGVGGAGGAGGAGDPDAGPTSKQCADYCNCYQTKCSVFVAIPGGAPCLDFCATFTPHQYECRFNMCFWNSKGPQENNNDHCQHTVGINECL